MSIRWLPRELGLIVKCNGTGDGEAHKSCPAKFQTANCHAGHTRAYLKKEGWGRGLTKGHKREDRCPDCMPIERELLAQEKAKKEAWKREKAERIKAKFSAEPKPKKPRKKKSEALKAGAVTPAEEANIGRPSSPSADSAPALAT